MRISALKLSRARGLVHLGTYHVAHVLAVVVLGGEGLLIGLVDEAVALSGIDVRDEHGQRVGDELELVLARPQALFALPQQLLLALEGRDVVNHADGTDDPPVRIAHQRRGDRGPDRGSIGPEVAFLDPVLGDVAADERGDAFGVPLSVLRVGQLTDGEP